MKNEQDRGDGLSMRGFVGEWGWLLRLIIGALGLLLVWRIARTEFVGTVRDYRAASEDGTVRAVIRAARADYREATQDTPTETEVARLQRQLAAERAARQQLEQQTVPVALPAPTAQPLPQPTPVGYVPVPVPQPAQ